MEQFFVYEDNLPDGAGYEYFGPEHFLCIAIFLLGIFVLWRICRKGTGEEKIHLLRLLSVCSLALELLKDFVLTVTGTMNLFELPLHICSLSIFVCLVNAYTKNRKVKEYTGNLASVLLLPAAVMAVVFPDYHIYPLFSFMNIYGYLGHFFIIGYMILLHVPVLEGETDLSAPVKIKLRYLPGIILFIFLTAIPVYMFDRLYHLNYYFINWPASGTPLIYLQEWFGKTGYKYAFLILLILLCLFMYGIWFFLQTLPKIRKDKKYAG